MAEVKTDEIFQLGMVIRDIAEKIENKNPSEYHYTVHASNPEKDPFYGKDENDINNFLYCLYRVLSLSYFPANTKVEPNQEKGTIEIHITNLDNYFNSEKYEQVMESEVNAAKESVVNHPNHYNQGSVEVINVIENVTLIYPESIAYHIGNVVKYVARAPFKKGKEDIEKALWYANRARNHTPYYEQTKHVDAEVSVDDFVKDLAQGYDLVSYLFVESIFDSLVNGESNLVIRRLDSIILDLEKLVDTMEKDN